MNLFEKLNRLDDKLVESKRVVDTKRLTESFEHDDDIDEMLTESEENYELATLVKDSINHLVNDLGKDPVADDFGDDVCADLENNYDVDVPQNPVKYADWCDAVMSEVSRQVNKVEEQLTEAIKIEPIVDKIVNVIERNGFTNRSLSSTDSTITVEDKDGDKTTYAIKVKMVPHFILEEELAGAQLDTSDKDEFIKEAAFKILNK